MFSSTVSAPKGIWLKVHADAVSMTRMTDRKLKVVPEPKPNTRVIYTGQILPFIKGSGNLNLLCGNCNAKLVEGINEGQVRNIVIQCPICKFHNEIP